MKTSTLYLAAILIAAATPVRAQTLPFYSVDAKAQCEAQAQKEDKAEKYKDNPALLSLTLSLCQGLVVSREQETRDELAKNWAVYDQRKRMWCIAQATSYYSLKRCLEVGVMESSQPSMK